MALGFALVSVVVLLLVWDGTSDEGEAVDRPDVGSGESADEGQPALVGRATVEAPVVSRVPVPVLFVPDLDPSWTRSRVVRVRVEGAAEADAVAVEVIDVHGSRVATASFSGLSEIAFRALAWGEYAVVARAGERIGTRPAAWDDVTVIALEPGRRIRGTAMVTDGDVLSGVSVRLHPEPLTAWGETSLRSPTRPHAVSDEAGRFEILMPRRTDDRTTWLACRHPLYGGVFQHVEPGTGPTEVVVQLGYRTDELVALHVVGDDGKDVVPAVQWSERAELGIPLEPTSARFRLAWPSRRRAPDLLVSAEGYGTVKVERPQDPTREVRVVLPKAAWPRVNVRDAKGLRVPYAKVTVLEVRRGRVEWGYSGRTDDAGVVWIPPSDTARVLWIQSPGFATQIVHVPAEHEEIPVLLEEDVPPIVVLPDDVPWYGSVDVELVARDGPSLWERQFYLGARETPLPGLPRGPKRAVVTLYGRDFRHEIAFDAERRLVVPRPGGWPGLAEVTVEIDGGGDLDGLRARLRQLGEKPMPAGSPVIEGGVVRCRLMRGRSYELLLPMLDKALAFPFDVPADAETLELRWRLPVEAGALALWQPRIVDKETGGPLGGGTLEVFDADPLGNISNRRYSRFDMGQASSHVAPALRQTAIVRRPGYATATVGPMDGERLLEVTTIELSRPLRLRVTWDAAPDERIQVFALDAKTLTRPSRINLSPLRGKGGSVEVEAGRSTAHVVWASGDRGARPRRVDAGTAQVELELRPSSGVDVCMPEEIPYAEDVRIWIEYRDVNLGYSTRGQWRPLPYADAVATPGAERDDVQMASLSRCPAGACTVNVSLDGELILERDVVLPPGEVLELTID